MRHKTPRGFIIDGIPADALLYDQNILDWTIVGALTGDRDYIGRGFVPTTRTLTAGEKAQIKWHVRAESRPSPLNGAPGGVYGREYTLRWLEYDAHGAVNAEPPVADPRAPAAAVASVGGGARPVALPVERMLKVPPWLFSAESDVYQTPDHLLKKNSRYAGDRVNARDWSHSPPTTALVHFAGPGRTGARLACGCCAGGL